jgi:hypothetical protein
MNTIQISKLGLIASLSSAIFYGCFSLFGKKLTGDYSPWTILLYIFGFASLTLLPFQILNPSPFPYQFPALIYFIGLILISTICGFALYTTALGHLQASIASITATSEIVFAAILAYFILGEMDLWQISWRCPGHHRCYLVSLPNGNPNKIFRITCCLGSILGYLYRWRPARRGAVARVIATAKALTTRRPPVHSGSAG